MKLIRRWRRLSRRKKIVLSAVILALAILGTGFALGWFDNKQEQAAEPVKYHSQLTGVEVSQELSERAILAIMLENSEEARPQTGLDSAGIVFETVTEGGITRYMAMFQENMPKVVEPVRSVRPAFVNWLRGFDASIAHVGGSTEGLDLLKQLHGKDLDQFSHPQPYRRDPQRPAPHNMIGDTEGLRKLQKELGFAKTSKFSEIPRSDDAPAQTPPAPKISLDFSSPLFAVEFRYDKTSNSYKRFLAGAPHIDAAKNKQITVKNVVVIKISGHDSNSLRPIGEGDAFVFKDGNVIRAHWKQASTNDRIKFTDQTGNEIPLNRGDTWISAVPSGRPIKF